MDNTKLIKIYENDWVWLSTEKIKRRKPKIADIIKEFIEEKNKKI